MLLLRSLLASILGFSVIVQVDDTNLPDSQMEAPEEEVEEIIVPLPVPPPKPVDTIADLIAKDPNFTTLLRALRETDLLNLLANPGPMTFFAPNNQAFAKLYPDKRKGLLGNKSYLKQVLLFHIIPDKALSASDTGSGRIATSNGQQVDIRSTVGGGLVINYNAKVVGASQIGSNGVILTVDTVLIPNP